MSWESRISIDTALRLSRNSSSVWGARNSQLAIPSNTISLRTWCSTEISYTCPGVVVSETYRPALAKVSGLQIPLKVPPPPFVTHRLGYCPSQRCSGSGAPERLELNLLNRIAATGDMSRASSNLTSSTREFSPALHSKPTARVLTPPV